MALRCSGHGPTASAADAIALLKDNGYDGWIMFEHEKRWHPELEDPAVIFPQFVGWARPLIG